jgi:glycosyltransferase involved in cell wall biosynthesis
MNSLRPTITVAIPSFNKEKYIDRCLKGILAEKENIAKIILVDNCSEDKTFELAKKYEPAIKCYRNETNLGMAGNWNRCIDLCQNEWLMIFHADDEMLPGAIAKYLEFIKKYPSVGMIQAAANTIFENKKAAERTFRPQKELRQAGLEALSLPQCVVCSTVMVKKGVYDKLGYFVPSMSSDVEMWARIGSKYDLGYINSPTINYHVNSSSAGKASLLNRSLKEIKKDWDCLAEKTATYYPTQETREAFIKNYKKTAPYNCLAVVKANLGAGKYFKALQTAWLIIFYYGDFGPLLKLLIEGLKKIINKTT